jgi:hypothetical protein
LATVDEAPWRKQPTKRYRLMSELQVLPDPQTLTAGLTLALRSEGRPAEPVTVLGREPNPYASTFPSEIVTCRLPDGSKRRLFCKYGAGADRGVHGHKGGVPYEAGVYRHLLQPLQARVPALYGAYTEDGTGRTWLICAYLGGSDLLHRKPSALSQAARWIGRFHQLSAACLRQAPLPFLNTYTAEYYLGWARRTSTFAKGLRSRYPWLSRLCERFEEAIALLLAPPLPVIHGEYYPGNILLHRGVVYPVDWESAAVAAGEIDLASLTERWSEAAARCCAAAYRRARWARAAPADFGRRLAAARLYLAFRWLGERPDWTTDERIGWRFEELRSAGERAGLI